MYKSDWYYVMEDGTQNSISSGNIPVFLQIILNLLIQLRKAFEVNMTTNTMEVKMHISAGDKLRYAFSY